MFYASSPLLLSDFTLNLTKRQQKKILQKGKPCVGRFHKQLETMRKISEKKQP